MSPMVLGNGPIYAEVPVYTDNLYVNEWYFLRHGIWNPGCLEWMEERIAFRYTVRFRKGKKEVFLEVKDEKGDNKKLAISHDKQSVAERERPFATSIFPNPLVRGKDLSIRSSIEDLSRVEILDLSGRTIYSQVVDPKNDSHSINIPDNVAPGIYLVKASNNQRLFDTMKLVIK